MQTLRTNPIGRSKGHCCPICELRDELFLEFVLGYARTGRRIPVVRLVWDQVDRVRFSAPR